MLHGSLIVIFHCHPHHIQCFLTSYRSHVKINRCDMRSLIFFFVFSISVCYVLLMYAALLYDIKTIVFFSMLLFLQWHCEWTYYCFIEKHSPIEVVSFLKTKTATSIDFSALKSCVLQNSLISIALSNAQSVFYIFFISLIYNKLLLL